MADAARVKVLPPLILLAALAAGFASAALVPARILPQSIAIPAGVAFIAASAALVAAAAREFRRANTAFDSRKPTTAIIETGVFAASRNPVYLSMMLLYLGLALATNSAAMLALAIPTGSVLCLLAIRPEETYLEAKFGARYRAYRERVPRWLALRRLSSDSSRTL
jgi:protein-S-isoprenylcysteine O-methyltransferase Ste14